MGYAQFEVTVKVQSEGTYSRGRWDSRNGSEAWVWESFLEE